VKQLTRALAQIATLASAPVLRREQINLQVALITPLFHVKGYAAPETKTAIERARQLIEQAEGLGEPPEDPLLLFSVLYGFWVSNYVASNGNALRDLATQFLTLAEKQGAPAPRLIAHRVMGISLACTGAMVDGRTHFDRGIALYDPAEHRPLATRFGVDSAVSILCYRSWTLWFLGYPEAALADSEKATSDAREFGQAATLIYALHYAAFSDTECGNYAKARGVVDELVALADEKGTPFWKALGTLGLGRLSFLTGKSADAAHKIAAGVTAFRSTGAGNFIPLYLSCAAQAYAELGQFDDACRRIEEAMTTVEATEERWWEAEVNRLAGEIALRWQQPGVSKAEAHFDRALAVARAQQAKSWELRAAMSMARLWRDQGKRQQAHDLLAPVYGWFTEGFDTLDLKQAKALLNELVP
jgi:predicted ATPase